MYWRISKVLISCFAVLLVNVASASLTTIYDPYYPITGIGVTSYSDANDHCEPWASRRINVDLNRGAGGQYIYLCIYRSPGYKPVTGLAIVGYKCPDGYQKINIDLNSGARVDKKITSAIYLCVAHNQDYYPYHYFGSPITSIEVTAHPTSSRNICKNPYRLEYDLNYSVGGDYIYICYDRDRSGYW